MQITKRLIAVPLVVGARTIQPVARVEGRGTTSADGTAHGGGMYLRLIPVEVVVREGDRTQTLAVAGPQRSDVRDLLRNALIVSGACLLVMVLARWMAARRKRRNAPL